MKFIHFSKKEFSLLFIALIIIILCHSYLNSLQQPLNDFIHKQLQKNVFNHPIKIIYFDDNAISQLHGWPISRNFYAYLIYTLNQLQVSVIGVDVFFPQTRSNLDEDDCLLVEMNHQFNNVVNSYYYLNSTDDTLPSYLPIKALDLSANKAEALKPGNINLPFPELLEANSNAGFSNVNVDKKGIIRTSPLVISLKNKLYPSFALRIAIEYLKRKHPAKDSSSLFDIFKSPIKNNYQVHYTVSPKSIEIFPAVELMQAFNNSNSGIRTHFDLTQFRDSIVLITVLSENYGSYKSVPVAANYPMAGIHAQIIENILNNQFLELCSLPVLFIILFTLLLLFFRIYYIRLMYAVFGLSGLSIIYSILFVVLFKQDIIMPIASIYLYLIFMAAIMIRSNYFLQYKQLANEKRKKLALEKELGEKISQLTELKNKFQQVQESDIKLLQEKISSFRSEIKRLQTQIKDISTTEPDKLLDSELQRLFPEIIFAESCPMSKVLVTVKKVAPSDSTVLITGESGTGKELVARAMHRLSDRKNKSFVAVNCAALTETLIESELFGHEKGAFTGAIKSRKGIFETANGGTVFLDEITETSPAFQAKLLRVVQEKEFYRIGSEKMIKTDVRIFAATNRDIKIAVDRREFREDLFYRLSVINIEIPPLRERKTDIPLLVQYFLQDESKQFSQAAMQILHNYHWPGNVRELQNLVQRSVILTDTSIISSKWVQSQIQESVQNFHKPDDFAKAILDKLREKEFQFSAISRIANELGHFHRSTITEHLKGIIFKTFYENHFLIKDTIRQLNHEPNTVRDQRLDKRIQSYLRNLRNSISTNLSFEENLSRLKSRFKNLPQKYHFYLEEIIRGYLEGEWNV